MCSAKVIFASAPTKQQENCDEHTKGSFWIAKIAFHDGIFGSNQEINIKSSRQFCTRNDKGKNGENSHTQQKNEIYARGQAVRQQQTQIHFTTK